METILATGGHDGHVRLWNPQTGKPLSDALKGHSKWITSLAWEPAHLASDTTKSPRLASSSKDGTVRIWNTANMKLEFSLGGHSASVNVVRWGGEGLIYTGSSDRTVKVWSGKDVSLHAIACSTILMLNRASSYGRWRNTPTGSTPSPSRQTTFSAPVLLRLQTLYQLSPLLSQSCKRSLLHDTRSTLRLHQKQSSLVRTIILSSCGRIRRLKARLARRSL